MRRVQRRRCGAVRDGDRHVAVAVLVEDRVAGPGVRERPRGHRVVALPEDVQLDTRPGDDADPLDVVPVRLSAMLPKLST